MAVDKAGLVWYDLEIRKSPDGNKNDSFGID